VSKEQYFVFSRTINFFDIQNIAEIGEGRKPKAKEELKIFLCCRR